MDANAPVSGQIVFRGAVGTAGSGGGLVPWEHSLGVGLLHVRPGAIEPERVHGILLGGRGDDMRLDFHGGPRPLNARYPQDAGLSDVGGLFTGMEVAAPSGPAALLSHGGLYLRRSRFPGPEGTETLIAAAIVRHGRGQLAERSIYELGGSLARISMTDPRPSAEAFPIGSAVEQTLRAPIWRARDGLRSVSSSLRLDVIDMCDELRELEAVDEGDRSPAQAARFQALSRSEAGSVIGVRRSDSDFARFKRLAREMGEDPPHRFSSYPTAEEIEAQNASVRRVVEAMFSGDRSPSPAMVR